MCVVADRVCSLFFLVLHGVTNGVAQEPTVSEWKGSPPGEPFPIHYHAILAATVLVDAVLFARPFVRFALAIPELSAERRAVPWTTSPDC